uniref:Apple domain-containing protein n=1 Tax=Nelumbo nucifera TaxID=4432 RepID=A0A822XQM0_NELNU|nr:TPA_asm: hypothetical protein HUJ06_023795 [Nelumbo nucifera]
MARVELGYQGRGKWCSYKRTTVIICCINIVAALYVLYTLCSSVYVFNNAPPNVLKYTPDQIRKMQDSIRIRKASEPIELVRLVKEMKGEFSREKSVVELSIPMKQKITIEILQRLKGLNANANVSEQRELVEIWRKEKLKEAKQLIRSKKTLNSTMLLEDIGLWIPAEIVNNEHDDKPEGEEELDDEVLAGPPVPPECHAELHTDYDGAAVRWGLTHPKESAADCCQACLEQAKRAKRGAMKCNIWVYCPSETGCYSPDIYEHKHQECWLKYAEKPKLNFKDKYSDSYRSAHPTAPLIVPWVSGVVST